MILSVTSNVYEQNIGEVLVIFWIVMSIYSGRYLGYTMDMENSDIGGRPMFVIIPQKWRWLFRFRNQVYADKYKLLIASVAFQLLGYFCSVVEITILLVMVLNKNLNLTSLATLVYVIYMLIGIFCIFFPNNIRYDYYMRRTYDYDWITYFKEELNIRPKRTCRIVSQIDENTYEITLGRFGKKKHQANADMQVKIGEKKYAVHIEHSLDKKHHTGL